MSLAALSSLLLHQLASAVGERAECLVGRNRRADGRKIHPAYLVEVKKPSESKKPWDYYKILATIPAEQAFRPIDQGGCELVKK